MDSRRFAIRTYGCQMNVHDSDKVASLLEEAGLSASPGGEGEADVLVINTCSIRDKAEHQLYSDLGKLREWKAERPGRLIGVGGCVAQQVGDRLLGRFSHLDFVFGTHNLRRVPAMVEGALEGRRAAWIGEDSSPDRFSLPARRPATESGPRRKAFVTVMEGCDMFCSFCIVPSTRGREISRRATEIEAEVRALVDQGIVEVTLLGQTVNAYGRHDVRRGQAAAEGTMPFADLLARLDAVPGLERIRYTSPHPLFYDEALMEAHGALESLCPHVHLPVQSGSNGILEAMRRRYTRERYLEITSALRMARPEVAITSDLIVGFPGESDADFEDTLDLVRDAGLVDSFSFKYSARPGTAAESMGGEVPADVAQVRLERLQQQQRDQTLAYHQTRVGERVEVLVEGESRRGGGQLSGRDPQHRVINFVTTGEIDVAQGERIWVDLVEATPHSLIGEARGDGVAGVRKDRSEVPGFNRSAVKSDTQSADESDSVDPSRAAAEDALRVL